jgi:pyruvate dehydrogenase E1 component alpha subunit
VKNKEFHMNLCRMMLLIRRTEEKIGDLYPEQEMKCAVHLSIGEEASAAGVCAALRGDDVIYSTHRCHAHYLAKGGNLKRMVAELYGKASGCCRGKGGSMHLADPEVGMMGSSAIVAGSIPLAVGSALAFSMKGNDRVAVALFGDGGAEQGSFSECLSFASLKSLPVIFVCENNLYATYTHISARQPKDNIHQRGEPYGVPGTEIDGNDVLAVYEAASQAVERCRLGKGPSLLECRTYRWRGHVGPDYDCDLGYRSKQELEEWMRRCPIMTYEKTLVSAGICSQSDLDLIRGEVDEEVARAVTFAKSSPEPELDDLLQDVY